MNTNQCKHSSLKPHLNFSFNFRVLKPVGFLGALMGFWWGFLWGYFKLSFPHGIRTFDIIYLKN